MFKFNLYENMPSRCRVIELSEDELLDAVKAYFIANSTVDSSKGFDLILDSIEGYKEV